MGYRDDFYKAENIIGFTGDLANNPTVYFADAGGKSPKLEKVGGSDKVVVSFGHITQAHSIAANVGREAVREAYSYSIFNVPDTSVPGLEDATGKLVAQECVYGEQELNKLNLEGFKTEPKKSRNEQHLDWHVSRNKFMEVSPGNLKILATAIDKHQNQKKC